MSSTSKELRVAVEQPRTKVREVFMAVDEDGGLEHIYTVMGPMPLIALDRDNLSILQGYCQQVANETGKTINIICFTGLRHYESFRASATGD